MKIVCCDDDRRRNAILASDVNGIDFIEVDDDPLAPSAERQRRIFVHFIKPLAPGQLGKGDVLIEGGTRIREIGITHVTSGADPASIPLPANVLLVEVSAPGDFSFYRLHITKEDGFDPILSVVEFAFKAACETDFDCQPIDICPPAPRTQPEINYLAKDYASFRQLMLDRMAVLSPAWTERNAADVGIALVELMAYVGDYLSYRQDAIATEAYLGTARRRTSLRRHARLVDYRMHDGANARVWIRAEVNAAVTIAAGNDPAKVPQFLVNPGVRPQRDLISRGDAEYAEAINGATLFEMLTPELRLDPAHNRMKFYTWGAVECCLPRGTTSADLNGSFPQLEAGMVLVLAEVRGAKSGLTEDADPQHRHAVKLTKVEGLSDPIGNLFASLPDPAPVTRITWDEADALPFPLCIASRDDGSVFENVSVAWGNIFLADHGRTVSGEELPEVPRPNPALQIQTTRDMCDRTPAADPRPARYTPLLQQGPVTFAAPYRDDAAASDSLVTDPAAAMPSRCSLFDPLQSSPWRPRRDLLGANETDRAFVIESEQDGSARLRFGDGVVVARPADGTTLSATYRVGNGAAGNIGRETIAVGVIEDSGVRTAIDRLTNPLAARGGIDPESLERVRQDAPQAFRTQRRAVTPDDYARTAQQCDRSVQRAAARFRWTGSWHTVFVTADRRGGLPLDPEFRRRIEACLENFRMAGHDVDLEDPRFVPLEVEMTVCVKRGYFTSEVERALREVFSNRVLPDGTFGVFHPDRFTFGQDVFLSVLYAAAQQIDGVDSVAVTKFQRQGVVSTEAIDSGRLVLDRLEIARLDNDPNFRENGLFTLNMAGGQ